MPKHPPRAHVQAALDRADAPAGPDRAEVQAAPARADGRRRPLRADALRNRERVLEVAFAAFAAEGLSVPVHEIARQASVGRGP